MTPSSRTPEGTPYHCPLCGNYARIELSAYPVCDATCPYCGHLLHVASPLCRQSPLQPFGSEHNFNVVVVVEPGAHPAPYSFFQQRWWTVLAVGSACVILVNDGPQHCVVWLLAMLALVTLVMPRLHQWGQARLNRSKNMYLGVILGWAHIPGPLVGLLFGTMLPAIYDCGISSLIGGAIGLIAGPSVAVIEGLAIACFVDGLYWLLTGRRLSATVA